MAIARVEFTVAPFTEGETQPHVQAAHDALLAAGFSPENGPFGTAVEGEADELLAAIAEAFSASILRGASNISMNATVLESMSDPADAFLAAVRPIAAATDTRIIRPSDLRPDDIPLHWEGRVVGGLRRANKVDTHLHGALDNLVREVEVELGGRLREMPRDAKQRAVRLLAERGAFNMRNAAEEVADAIGVSRVTVYNYLNATRRGHVA